MTEASTERIQEDSGILEFLPHRLEEVPEGPGVYLLLSAGQKVIYVGEAGEGGLRDTLWELYEEQVFSGASAFRYLTTADREAAAQLAQELIQRHKPTYTIGFHRVRPEDISLPKQGHKIRRAVPNPP